MTASVPETAAEGKTGKNITYIFRKLLLSLLLYVKILDCIGVSMRWRTCVLRGRGETCVLAFLLCGARTEKTARNFLPGACGKSDGSALGGVHDLRESK